MIIITKVEWDAIFTEANAKVRDGGDGSTTMDDLTEYWSGATTEDLRIAEVV